MSNSIIATVDVNDGQNHPTFVVKVDARPGRVIAVTVHLRETPDSEVLARLHLNAESANVLGQAFMLAATVKGDS